RPDGRSGWILDAWGGIHAFGGAPRFQSPVYRRDVDHARDIVASPNGRGGWIMTTDGYIAAFGGAPGVYHRSTWTGLDLGRSLMLRRGDQVDVPAGGPPTTSPGTSPTVPTPSTTAPPDEILS